jgi:nucleoside-diphosphate-sugar epimerase
MAPEDVEQLSEVFNEEIQLSKVMVSAGCGHRLQASNLWYAFIGMQVFQSVCAFWVNAGFLRSQIPCLKLLANVLSMGMIAASVFITHAMGGKWKHIHTGYTMFQPFKGGKRYCILQALGWICFCLAMILGLTLLVSQVRRLSSQEGRLPDNASPIVGILGVAAEIIITASLFVYHEPVDCVEFQGKGWATGALLALTVTLFKDRTAEDRVITSKSTTDYLKGERKFQELVKDVHATGDQYLVIGCGFLGTRLVKRLLQRGEQRVRVFDISPRNPFAGDERVEYISGDVTNPSSIGPACAGVDTVYATFAIIRYMDRLEHQAALSYRVNVIGTEVMIEACKERNVKRVVVTSSSHCTTDEHSLPRLGRDETAPYVRRETAHNHYGWTKAIADKHALESNGSVTSDGSILRISVVRPCSGVFASDDRFSMERMLTMGYYLSPFGSTTLMDWIYADNVVLGHILLEHALQEGKSVDGEAYCVSNEEPVTMYGFWTSVEKHLEVFDVGMSFTFIWIPFWPILILGYISEWTQRIFKGRVSLGDIDFCTPGTLITSAMAYTYTSGKAKRDLGYEPAWTIDEGIQQSIAEYIENHNICREPSSPRKKRKTR